jgi:hypothetical protein
MFSVSGGLGETILFLKMPHIGSGVKALDKKDFFLKSSSDKFYPMA